jgi:cytochrome c biogenesis protein CcmG, thiol:disulfide interchange protein DsbE
MPPFAHEEPKPPVAVKSRVVGAILTAAVLMAVAVAYWTVVAWLFPQPNLPKPEIHSGVGQPLRYLELRPLTGNPPPVSLPDLENRVTLLNFWGTWCPPCRNELPHIAELRQRYAGQKTFRLLAVSCPAGGQPDDVQSLQDDTAALLKRLGLDLPTYYDPDGGTQYALGSVIDLEAFPTSVLLDRRGVIRAVWVGYRPGVETEMERHIGTLLDEEPNPPQEDHGGTENTEKRR